MAVIVIIISLFYLRPFVLPPNYTDIKHTFTPSQRSSTIRLFCGKKNFMFLFPATTEKNITRVNFLREARESSILMAIDALDAILSIHLLPLAKI